MLITFVCFLLCRKELEEYCYYNHALISTAGIPYFYNNVIQKYIGMYGNADPSDVNQWLVMDLNSPSVTPSWDARTLTCSGMITGLDFKFLVVSAGEKSNPQNKIVSAIASFTSSDLKLRYCSSSCCSSSSCSSSDSSSSYCCCCVVVVSIVIMDVSRVWG